MASTRQLGGATFPQRQGNYSCGSTSAERECGVKSAFFLRGTRFSPNVPFHGGGYSVIAALGLVHSEGPPLKERGEITVEGRAGDAGILEALRFAARQCSWQQPPTPTWHNQKCLQTLSIFPRGKIVPG